MADADINSIASDPSFQSMSVPDKMGYLSHVFPEFESMSPPDKLGYISHLSGYSGVSSPSVPEPNMQTSSLPNIVRASADALPVAGGLAGALAGAPAAGYGALLGGGLGAAAGESGRQLLMNKIFGEGPSPVSKQGLTQTAIAGGIGAASEVPGAIANAVGGKALSGITQAVPRAQTGSAARALEDVAPVATSGKGMTQDLEVGRQALVQQLNGVIGKSTGTADLDALLQNARVNATTANSSVKGTLSRFDKVVAAAKLNAGVTDASKATPQQLLSFMQELQKPAYAGNPGPVQAVLKNLLGNAYSSTGAGLRGLSPESDQLLSKLSDIYAAKAGLKTFQPNAIQAMGATAALHPRTTAIASPVVSALAAAGSGRARKGIQSTAEQLIP